MLRNLLMPKGNVMDNITNELLPKYNMTLEQNIFVAKRNIVDYIWKSAHLEGIAITYPDTQTICDGLSVSGYSIDEINAINDLKHAWRFLLDNIEEPITYEFMRTIHRHLGKFTVINAGMLRNGEVRIGGTDWIPEIPNENKIKNGIENIINMQNSLDKAFEMFLFCVRGQFFYDGNKRLANLMANKVMIQNGLGIISIPIEHKNRFLQLLIEFYETNQKSEIKKFIYDNCIDGIAFT